MEFKDYTARSVDEAITKACLELGVTSDRLDYTVKQEASSGFLGLGAKPAVISARARTEEELKKEQEAIEAADQKAKESVVDRMVTPSKTSMEKASEKAAEKKIITNDEIEKRAALAAARAKEEGTDTVSSREGKRPERRSDSRCGSRDRRDRNDRYGKKSGRYGSDRRGGRYEKTPEIPDYVPSQPKPERVVTPKTEEEVAELTKKAEEFLTDVFKSMDLEVTITSNYDQKEGSLNMSFAGDEMGILIGKRGQTLDSLQYLTSLVINKGKDDYTRVKLDTEDYRGRREETLTNLARNIAFKVKKTRRPVALEPMNPYERRIIHSALQENKFVETYSEGEEPYRHVVVTPKKQ